MGLVMIVWLVALLLGLFSSPWGVAEANLFGDLGALKSAYGGGRASSSSPEGAPRAGDRAAASSAAAGDSGSWVDVFLRGPVPASELAGDPSALKNRNVRTRFATGRAYDAAGPDPADSLFARHGGGFFGQIMQAADSAARAYQLVRNVMDPSRELPVATREFTGQLAEEEDDRAVELGLERGAGRGRRRGGPVRVQRGGASLLSRSSGNYERARALEQDRISKSIYLQARSSLRARHANVTDWLKTQKPCENGVGRRVWEVNNTMDLCRHEHCVLNTIECPGSVLQQVGFTGVLTGSGPNFLLNRTHLRSDFPGLTSLEVYENCTVKSVVCNDKTVTEMEETYNVRNCKATAFACIDERSAKIYEVARPEDITVQNPTNSRKSIELITVANSSDCEIQMTCEEPDGNYGAPKTNSESGYSPQDFGFLLWGARCRSQRVTCNGVVQDTGPNFQASWQFADDYANCTVEFVPCTYEEQDAVRDAYLKGLGFSVSQPSAQDCDHIESICDGDDVVVARPPVNLLQDPEQDVCQASQLRVPAAVCQVPKSGAGAGWAKSWPGVNCRPKTVNCNGTAISADEVPAQNAGLINCTAETLSCSAAANTSTVEYELDAATLYGSGKCQFEELDCQDAGALISGNYTNCVVPSLICDASGLTNNATCLQVRPVCADAAKCRLTPEIECAKCSGPLNVSRCLCPVDRYGETCGDEVPLKCDVAMISPEKRCMDNLKLWYSEDEISDLNLEDLSGDWPCLVMDLDRVAQLTWTLDCKFDPNFEYPDEPPRPTASETATANFSYWLYAPGAEPEDGPRFALSQEQSWAMVWKIFNFNRFTDDAEMYDKVLTRDQMAGLSTFFFRTNTAIGEIDAQRFWHGNRLYSELSWRSSKFQPEGSVRVLAREFIDNPDFTKHEGNKIQEPDVSAIVGWSVAGGVLVLLIVGYAVARYRKRRREKKLMEAKLR